MNSDSLPFSKQVWIIIWVVIWLVLSVGLMPFIPLTAITPALPIHLCALLLMLFCIKRYSGNIKNTLLIHQTKFRWALLAVAISIIYWYMDHWLMSNVLQVNLNDEVLSWQQNNAKFHYVGVLISTVFIAPVFEELFFRGLIYSAILQRLGLFWGVSLSALLFAMIHWSWPEFISLFVIGVIYALLAHKSRSVLVPMIAHLAHNAMTYTYYIQPVTP